MVNSQNGISLQEQRAIQFFSAFYGFYPNQADFDKVSLCPLATSNDNFVCKLNSDNNYYLAIITIKSTSVLNPSIIPDYSILPLDLPSLESITISRPNSFDITLNPLNFFKNISQIRQLVVSPIYNSTQPVIPNTFPMSPFSILTTVTLRYTQQIGWTNSVAPYKYNFSSYLYPQLTTLVLQDFPNGTFFIDSPLVNTISIYSYHSNLVVTNEVPQLKVVNRYSSNTEFVLNGLLLTMGSVFRRDVIAPTLYSLDGLANLSFEDYENFYLPATNSTIPNFLYCNPKLNITYLPSGYESYVNQSRMCGAFIHEKPYFVAQDSKITITGENLFVIPLLQNKNGIPTQGGNFPLEPMDHTVGLEEIERFKVYSFNIQSLEKSGNQTIIFSKFNGISFTIEWYKEISIKNVTHVNTINGLYWKIEGIFTFGNLNISIGQYPCNIYNSTYYIINCVSDDIPSDTYRIHITNGNDTDLFYNFDYVRVVPPYIRIKQISFTQIVNAGIKLLISGDFTDYNHSLYINGEEITTFTMTSTSVATTLYQTNLVYEGVYNITMTNYGNSVSNITIYNWSYPSISNYRNDGLALYLSGYYGGNLNNLKVEVEGNLCSIESYSISNILCTMAMLTPDNSSKVSITVDGFKKIFKIPIFCDCHDPSGYCSTHSLCDEVSTTTSTPTPSLSSSIILSPGGPFYLLSILIFIFLFG